MKVLYRHRIVPVCSKDPPCAALSTSNRACPALLLSCWAPLLTCSVFVAPAALFFLWLSCFACSHPDLACSESVTWPHLSWVKHMVTKHAQKRCAIPWQTDTQTPSALESQHRGLLPLAPITCCAGLYLLIGRKGLYVRQLGQKNMHIAPLDILIL